MRIHHITLYSLLFLTVACGEKPEYTSERAASSASEQAESPVNGPAVNPTAAPGVAFNYSYQFRLPHIQIAQVQEEHALACEKLGITKCRITGMQYTVLGESEIKAMLAFKLAPEIARQFGKSGIAAVEKAEGMVVETEISGTDVSGSINAARQNEDEIGAQIARLEKELVKGGLTADTRAGLIAQIEKLNATKRENQIGRTQDEDALANTPMVFTYLSGGLIPGFDARSPIREAIQTAADVLIGVLSFLIVATAFLIPLLVFAGIVMLGWRRFRPIWAKWLGNETEIDR